MVQEGKALEDQSMQSFGVFEKIKKQDAVALNATIVKSRYMCVQKQNPDRVKVRLIANQVRRGSRGDVWAGAPTSIGQRLVLALSALCHMQVGPADVRTAFLHAPLPEDEVLCIVPPPSEEKDPEVLWRCRKALYGFQKSPAYFQEWLAEQLTRLHWHRSSADPCFFFSTGSMLSHHADDLILAAPGSCYTQLWTEIEGVVSLKRLPDFDGQWRPYLGRHWRRTANGWQVKMRSEYYDAMTDLLDLTKCRQVLSPLWPDHRCRDADESPLDENDAVIFRQAVGKLA